MGFEINPPSTPIGHAGVVPVMIDRAWYRFLVEVQKVTGSGLIESIRDSEILTYSPSLALPNSRQLLAGTALTLTPGPGMATIDLDNTAVLAGSYGTSSRVGAFTVDSQGRLTFAGDVAIDPVAIGAVPATRTLTAGAGLTGGGDLTADRSFDVGAGTGITVNANDVAISNTTVAPGSYGTATQVGTFTVNAQGQLTAAANVAISVAASSVTGVALTKVDDTNVTLTLGGSPATALVAATSLTLGWTGTLGVARGGTNIASYTAGDLIYATGATTLAKLAIGANNFILGSNGTAPVWVQNTGTGNAVRATLPQFTSTIGVGVAANASGSGVSFPATQSASTDPNTLDDYEEAAYTPSVTPGSGAFGALGTITGSYTKIGRQVTATIGINITTNGTAAGRVDASLPFTSKATDVFVGVGKEGALTGDILSGTVLPSTATVQIFKNGNVYPGGNGARIDVTVTYFV